MKPIDNPVCECPKCNTNMLIHFSLFVVGPSGLESNVTKEAIRDKRVYFEGAGWRYAYHHCPKCGHSMNRFTEAYKVHQAKEKAIKEVISNWREAEKGELIKGILSQSPAFLTTLLESIEEILEEET